jgi:hypothetical protein
MMLCFIYKWFISSALDTGKPAPGFVHHHLKRCKACHTFATRAFHLNNRLESDSDEYLQEFQRPVLQDKILAQLPSGFPASHASTNWRNKRALPGMFYIKPVFAALLALVIVITAAIWISIPGTGPKQTKPAILADVPPVIDKAGESLQKFAVNLESPLHKEVQSLKQAAKSTRDFFASYLDFEI